MKKLIKYFGLLILLIGLTFFVKPEIILGWLEDNITNNSLYLFAIVARLFFGVLLILAAKESKYPTAIKIFGYLAIIAAVTFLFMGKITFQEFVSARIPDIKDFSVLIGFIALLIGWLLIYAFSSTKKIKE